MCPESSTIPDINEAERLAILRGLNILDTQPDPALDALVQLASELFGTETATITLVDQDRQWRLAKFGSDVEETPRDIAFCNVAIQNDSVLVVSNAATDPSFRQNPLVLGPPFIRFYAGAPLTVQGARIGTLCVIDPAPREDFTARSQKLLATLAAGAAAILDMRQEVVARRSLSKTLEERTRTLALAETLAGIGHWSVDLPTGQVFWSEEVYRIHGVVPGEWDPMLNSAIEFYAPEDREEVISAVQRSALTGEPFSFKRRLFRKSDGAQRTVHSKAEAKLDADGNPIGLFGVFQDITEQEALFEQITSDREKYRLLTENGHDLIIVSEASGIMTFVSPSSQTLLGYPPEALLNHRTLEFVHKDDRTLVRTALGNYLAAGPNAAPIRIQCRLVHKDGHFVWIESHPRAVYSPLGTWVGFQDVLRDITAQKELEIELVAARAAAEASARVKADFVANMSHELRTPLNGILGFTEVLASRNRLDKEDKRFVELISESGRRLLSIVNDVLDLSKIEAGATSLNAHPTDLCPLLSGTMDLVRGQATNKGLRATLNIPPETIVVLVDADRLRQIVLNLLGNALKFTERGEVALSLRTIRTNGKVAAEIEVRDTGIGIPADRVDALFQRFEQADSSISRQYGGTGLGLSISRALAAQMGGQIRVTSTPGEGSRFTLKLELPEAELAPAAPPLAANQPHAALAGLRLLVAEDVKMNQELIKLFLEPTGMRIDFADNGVGAVDAAAKAAYDAILMDMQMPVMDGLEATRRIRAGQGPSAQTPIIALTANIMEAEIQRCRLAGMNDHVGKPFSGATLIKALTEWAKPEAQPKGHTKI